MERGSRFLLYRELFEAERNQLVKIEPRPLLARGNFIDLIFKNSKDYENILRYLKNKYPEMELTENPKDGHEYSLYLIDTVFEEYKKYCFWRN